MLCVSTSCRFTLAGVAFGALFPLIATFGLALENDWTILETQIKAGWLLWIIDSAPFFLGIFARIGGVRQEELEKLNTAHLSTQNSPDRYNEALFEFLRLKSIRENKSPVFVFLGSLAILSMLSISAFLAVRSYEIDENNHYVAGRAKSAVDLFHTQLSERLLALDRMAMRFREPSAEERTEWQADARAYYTTFDGFQAVEWADQNGVIQWIYPMQGNETALGLQLKREQNRRTAIKQALLEQKGMFSNPIRLKQGGLGFLTVHPTGRKKHNGFIVGVFRVNEIFSNLLDQHFKVAIYMSHERVFVQGFADEELPLQIAELSPGLIDKIYSIQIRNVNFQLVIASTPQLLSQFRDPHAWQVLFFFLILSAFISLFIARYFFVHQRVKKLLQEVEVTQSALDEVAAVSYTNINGVIEAVNERFLQITNRKKDEVIGRHFRQINFSKSEDRFIESLWSQISSGESWTGEVKSETSDGQEYWVNTSIVPKKDSSGLVAGFTAIRIDITDKKKAEQDILDARNVAENALATKARFLANMSHEIRTPMNGIIGLTTLMLSEIKDPQIRKNLQVIDNCGESLLSIVDDILDFSKLEAGKTEIEQAPFDLHATIHDIRQLLEVKASEKSVDIEVKINPNTPQWIIGDQVKVRQILTNLAGNAVKFTEKGRVGIECRGMAGNHKQHTLVFKIEDTGIGMPQDVQDRLFRSFSQADASTTRKFGGSGLGLVISKGLVELMGGEIEVSSVEGQGSTFVFTMPAEETEAIVENKENTFEADFSQTRPLKILVAEDNATNQFVIMSFLSKLGFASDVAVNGEEVLKLLETETYDLIFMDCHMPRMDGFEATEEIIRKYPTRPKIVALTASSMEVDRRRCEQAGMDAFMSKPVTVARLKEMIDSFATNKKAAS